MEPGEGAGSNERQPLIRVKTPMWFLHVILIGYLLLAPAMSAQEDTAGIEEIMEQLPADMQENYVDPTTVQKNPSFAQGESLRFKLGWGIFSVAKASLQTEQGKYQDRDSLKITLSTETNSFADAFYRVRNTSISWMDDDVSRSFEYAADQDEGGRRRDSHAVFDTENLTASYFNKINGDSRGPVRILPGTVDPLGIVFLARSLDFEVGDDLVIPTSNGKEFFYTIIRVSEKVTRNFRFGKMEAYVLEPDIKDLGGVFKKSPDGKIRFFLSADERKLPLRMESEVAVGKFWAELVEVEDPQPGESVTVPEVE